MISICSFLQEVTYRKVLHDDKKGRQKVEVEQLAAWKFLMFSGSFTTRLYVTQDKPQGVVREKTIHNSHISREHLQNRST